MNCKAIALIVAIALGGMGTVNGQFLKKLGKKVEKAAERTVERRAERETEKNTDKALDKVFEAGSGKEKEGKGEAKETAGTRGNDDVAAEEPAAANRQQSVLAGMLGGASMGDVPDTYTFSYRATMKIVDENEKEDANVLYWLEPDATYFGTQVLVEEGANQIAVMDMDINGMVMFMDNGKQKTAMHIKGNQQLMDTYLQKTTAGEGAEEVAITPIEGKTILGYACKGFQMETEDGISKVWVTDEAPVGIIDGMLRGGYIPEGLPDFGPKTLFMEMEYTPKNGKEGNVSMVCTELKPLSMAIHKKEYQ